MAVLFMCVQCYIRHTRYIITITGVVSYGSILFARLIEVKIGRDQGLLDSRETKQWRNSPDKHVILGRRKLGSRNRIYFIIYSR